MAAQCTYTEHVHDVNYYMAGKLILWPVKYNPAGHSGRYQKCLAETLEVAIDVYKRVAKANVDLAPSLIW